MTVSQPGAMIDETAVAEGAEMMTETPTTADTAEAVEAEPARALPPAPADIDDPDKHQADASAIVDAWKAGGDLVEPVSTLPDLSHWQMMEAIATKICRSKMVPKAIRESQDPEADCLVTLLMAHDLGISITLAFQKTMVIDGKPGQQAELMRILAIRDGHKVWYAIGRDEVGRPTSATCYVKLVGDTEATHAYKGSDDDVCMIEGCGHPVEHAVHYREATYTLKDAVTAGLCTIDANGNPLARSSNSKRLPWEAYTEDMLIARCTSRGLRRATPLSLGGVSYTPEELGAIDSVASTDVERIEAPQAVLDLLVERVDALDDDVKATVAAKWKEAKIGALRRMSEHTSLLSTDQIPIAKQLIDDAVRETPAEVLVLTEHAFEGPETATECATCGHPRDHELHPPDEESEPDARDSDPAGITSEATATTGAGVPPTNPTGEPTATTADPTAEPARDAPAPSAGPTAAPGPVAEPETAAEPVSRAAVRLPDLGRKKAQRVCEIQVEIDVDGVLSKQTFQVGYQLVSLPLAAKRLDKGTHVEFTAGAVQHVGVVIGDYLPGEVPF